MKLIKANQSNFLVVLVEKITKIDSINNGICIFGDFSIDLCLNESSIFFKKYVENKSIPSAVKNYYEF